MACGASVDETSERWLVQKDRLDFGPFSLRDLRTQIETGKVQADHVLIDTETQQRCFLREHPILRPLVLQAETQLAEQARQNQTADERKKHNKRVVLLLFMLIAVLSSVGAGVGWWYIKHPKTIVVKEKDTSDIDFLKSIQISLKVDPPEKKKATKRGPLKKGQKPGQFDEATNLGDASSEGGDETLSQTQIQEVMGKNTIKLVGCVQEARRANPGLRSIDMELIVRGNGLTSAVKANGATNSPLASCLLAKMQSVPFPKFNGSKTQFSFSFGFK
jgi:hypothetical protein